jgi:hypothetical protein
MGLFRRFLSTDFRKAVAAEAQGDFLTAARHYALCGETSKVADMHLAQARAETSADDRIRALRTALSFARGGDTRRTMVLRLLGRALRERALAPGTDVEARRQDLEEAGALLEEGEAWESAGDGYLELGDRGRAAAAYAKAGLVERVEEVLGQQEQERDRARREDALFRDYEMLLQGGQRDEAAEALRGCIDAAERKGEYRRLLSEFEPRVLSMGRLQLQAGPQPLLVIGHFPLVLGRDGDCDLMARGASVSRRHAHVLAEGDVFSVADCGSRNGTQLNGVSIGATLPLPPAGSLGLGESCRIAFTVEPAAPPILLLTVEHGLDQGRHAAACAGPLLLPRVLPDAPIVELSFQRGRPFAAAPGGELRLNGARVGTRVQLIAGDTIELDGKRVQVVG